jgi:hypothetical protein
MVEVIASCAAGGLSDILETEHSKTQKRHIMIVKNDHFYLK